MTKQNDGGRKGKPYTIWLSENDHYMLKTTSQLCGPPMSRIIKDGTEKECKRLRERLITGENN